MKLSLFLMTVLVCLLPCRIAQADFYIRQDVHATQTGLDGALEENGTSDFKRKIYGVGQVLAIQIEEKGRLKKEYGFDFAKNLYYEADPGTGHYKWFDLGVLEKAFEKMSREARSLRGSRKNATAGFTRALLEGQLDYPVRVRQALFGKKRFSGNDARLYKLRAGPGTSFLNFFGWYRKADIWASRGLPGFSEYTLLRAKLNRKAAFYKIKHNRVSDLITTLSALEPMPLRIDTVAKRRFGRVTALETTREITSAVSTAKVQTAELLYFKQRARFSWNVAFSKGTEFGPEVSLERGEDFSWRRSLPWMVLPVFFLGFTCVWFLGSFQEKDRLSLAKKLVLWMYLLSALLFALQAAHYLGDIPYLFSPLLELVSVAVGGVFVIAWQARAHLRTVERQMRESHLQYCPHCHARCEQFYVVCPKCNRAIMPTQAHESKFPPT